MGACSYAFLHLLFSNVVLPLFMFLVASFSSGCFFILSVLFSLGRRGAPFFCLRLFRFLFVCFSRAVFHPARSQQFAELGSIDFLAFSARAFSAFLCSAILFLGTCMTFYFYFLIFLILISFPKAGA